MKKINSALIFKINYEVESVFKNMYEDFTVHFDESLTEGLHYIISNQELYDVMATIREDLLINKL